MAIDQKEAKKRERPRVPRKPRRSWRGRVISALQALGLPHLTVSTHAAPGKAYRLMLQLSMRNIESLRERMHRDQEEIEQLKAETRQILSKLGGV